MTGVSAIQYYSVTIYGQIGIVGSDALKYQAINNIIGLLGEGFCVLLIDRLGRRRPLITGNLCNMVSMIQLFLEYANKHFRSAFSLHVS
jgi:hypothetical protein